MRISFFFFRNSWNKFYLSNELLLPPPTLFWLSTTSYESKQKGSVRSNRPGKQNSNG